MLYSLRYNGFRYYTKAKRFSASMEILKNKMEEMTAGAYLISIAEVANSAHQIGTGALLIINNCTLGLFLENDGKYQFENVKKNT